jgi:hypothetical protein
LSESKRVSSDWRSDGFQMDFAILQVL